LCNNAAKEDLDKVVGSGRFKDPSRKKDVEGCSRDGIDGFWSCCCCGWPVITKTKEFDQSEADAVELVEVVDVDIDIDVGSTRVLSVVCAAACCGR